MCACEYWQLEHMHCVHPSAVGQFTWCLTCHLRGPMHSPLCTQHPAFDCSRRVGCMQLTARRIGAALLFSKNQCDGMRAGSHTHSLGEFCLWLSHCIQPARSTRTTSASAASAVRNRATCKHYVHPVLSPLPTRGNFTPKRLSHPPAGLPPQQSHEAGNRLRLRAKHVPS